MWFHSTLGKMGITLTQFFTAVISGSVCLRLKYIKKCPLVKVPSLVIKFI